MAGGSDDRDTRDGIPSDARGSVRGEVQTFLTTRRASQYYTKLERGNATGVSDSLIEGIARALQLDEAERTHLIDLIRAAGTTRGAPPGGPATGSVHGASASSIP